VNARDATAVLDALPLAVLMAEPGGRVTYANPAAHALFSHDVETLTPMERARCWATRHVDGSAMSADELPTMRAIRGERLRNFEYRITHADGSEHRVLVSSEPIEGPGGRPLGAACVFEDVTERRRSEQRLADALSDQTASALENARLSDALRARADRLRRITELNRFISASLDIAEVLREIGRAAADLARAEVVGFWLLDPERATLELKGGWGEECLRDVPTTSLSSDASLVGWVARQRRPLNVPDVLGDPRFLFREWAVRNGLRAFLGIPIVLGDALKLELEPFDLMVCFLTAMFFPVADRRSFFERSRSLVRPGGAIVVVDKTEPAAGYAATVMWRMVLSAKVAAGVDHAEIVAKELSLGGVQRPLDPAVLGPGAVEWFRYGDFAGWLVEGPRS